MILLILIISSCLVSFEAIPECRWACDDPVCHAVCIPVCEPVKCQVFRNDELNTLIEDVDADCEIICDDSGDPSESCPLCETRCQKPVCPEFESCQVMCEGIKCAHQCDKPTNCQSPRCELVCERPACESTLEHIPTGEIENVHNVMTQTSMCNNSMENSSTSALFHFSFFFLLLFLMQFNIA